MNTLKYTQTHNVPTSTQVKPQHCIHIPQALVKNHAYTILQITRNIFRIHMQWLHSGRASR